MGILQDLQSKITQSKQAFSNIVGSAIKAGSSIYQGLTNAPLSPTSLNKRYDVTGKVSSDVKRQVSETINIGKPENRKSAGILLTPLLQTTAAMRKLPKPIQSFVDNPKLFGTAPQLPKRFEHLQAQDALVRSGLNFISNLAKGAVFGDPKRTKQVLDSYSKVLSGKPITSSERKELEKFANEQQINFILQASTGAIAGKLKVPKGVPLIQEEVTLYHGGTTESFSKAVPGGTRTKLKNVYATESKQLAENRGGKVIKEVFSSEDFFDPSSKEAVGELISLFNSKKATLSSETIIFMKAVENEFSSGTPTRLLDRRLAYFESIPEINKLLKDAGYKGIKLPYTADVSDIAGNVPSEFVLFSDSIQKGGSNIPTLPTTEISDILTPEGQVKIKPQELNVNKLDLTLGEKLDIQQIGAKEVRETLKDSEILKIAKGAGLDTKTYSLDQTAEVIAEQLNTRNRIVELEKIRINLQASGGSTEELIKVTKEMVNLLGATSSQGTDVARQLRARQIVANELDTPMQRVFKLLREAGVNPDEYIKRSTSVDFNDPKQVQDFFRELVPSKWWDWTDKYRYANMLSSPTTHTTNIGSNVTGTALVTPIEKTITGGLDWLASTSASLIGKNRPRQTFAGEGLEYAKGYFPELKNAAHKFADVMSGTVTSNAQGLDAMQLTTSTEKLTLGKLELPIRARALENVWDFPLKALKGVDEFFRVLSKGGLKKSYEYRISKGVPISNLETKMDDEAIKRLFNAPLGKADEGNILNAMSEVGRLVNNLRNNKNPIVSSLAKIYAPFVKVATNLAKQSIEYSPLGFTTIWKNPNKTEQISKAIMGSSVTLGASILASSGRLRGAPKSNQKEEQAYLSKGIPPYSVKIGNKWISYQKMHPLISANFALVSATHDVLNKKSTDDEAQRLLDLASKYLMFFADQSLNKSIGEFVKLSSGDPNAIERFTATGFRQFIPFSSFFAWLERAVDPVQRKPSADAGPIEKTLQEIMKTLPGLAENVPVREDLSGEPIQNTDRILNMLSPFGKITTETQNPEADYYLESLDIKRENRVQNELDDKAITKLQEKLKKKKPR